MAVLINSPQTRWRDSYASAPEIRLTLRSNGEEAISIFDGQANLVPAGIDAPTAIPICIEEGTSGGSLSGYYCYRIVYAATSRYPYVENAVTGGGSVAPRSNPGPSSTAFLAGTSGRTVVTIVGTSRADIDRIWVYRTISKTTAVAAAAEAAAGNMFFLESIANPGNAVPFDYVDSGTIALAELLEIDNLPSPQFQYCVYDGIYFWGFGANPFTGSVSLDGTSTITLTDGGQWFDGRDGQFVTFDGVTTGGADGRGTFYFKWLTSTTAQLCQDQAGTIPLVAGFTGSTTVTIQGYPTTLYRSKPRNPFSWGWTENQISDTDGSVLRVPQTWAYKVGGGIGTALALVPNDRVLKLDTESPARCYTLNLNNAASPDTIGATRQIIQDRFTASHFSQFAATMESGQTVLRGIDAKNFSFITADSSNQAPVISGELKETLRALQQSGDEAHFYHGCYDASTELNCWWVKTRTEGFGDVTAPSADTLLWNHAPTGLWGKMDDHDITASASIFDPQTEKFITLLGSDSGAIMRGFSPGVYSNAQAGPAVTGFTIEGRGSFFVTCSAPAATLDGKYLILTSNRAGGEESFAIWFTVNGSGTTIPAAAAACTRSIQVDLTSTNSAAAVAALIVSAFLSDTPYQTDPSFYILAQGSDSASLNFAIRNGQALSFDAGNSGFNGSFSTQQLIFDQSTGGAVHKGTWSLVLDELKNPVYWARSAGYSIGVETYVIGIDRYYETGSDEISAVINATGEFPTYTFLAGIIQTRARTYFDLQSPSATKRGVELWMTSQNVDPDSAGQWCAFFREFDDTSTKTFQLERDTKPGSTVADSVNWITKTKFPSTMLNQFGVEFSEYGFDAWRLMSITLKYQT